MILKLPDESKLLITTNEVVYPDYQFWWDWIESQKLSEDETESAWQKLVETWLTKLQTCFSSPLLRADSKDFIVLSQLSARETELISLFASEVKNLIGLNLSPEAQDWSHIPVLVFQTRDEYERYLTPIYEMDGLDLVLSNGVYLAGHSYPHIVVLADSDLSTTQGALAHELSHLLIAHHEPPRWLDEGIAQLVEQETLGRRGFQLDPESFMKHKTFWSDPDNLEDFWSGDLFYSDSDEQRLAYEFAEVLVKNLMRAGRENMISFIREAKIEDAGFAAAQAVYAMDLNAFVRDMLSSEQ